MMKGPLDGYKVVELGTHAAVPLGARLLADWGADVIKVEGLSGDEWRILGASYGMPIKDEENPTFTMENANKRFVSLNLKSEAGKELMFKLLAQADAFICNVRLKSLQKLGLDYESIKQRFPRLVYAHFSGFGYEGADAARPGFDKAAYWARGGVSIDFAYEGDHPINPMTAFGDGTVGSLVAAGVLAALLGRANTGKGTFLSSTLFGGVIWYNGIGVICTQDAYGNPYPKNYFEPPLPFSHIYKCQDDEWIIITVVDHNGKYEKMCRLLGMEEYLGDDRFTDILKIKPHLREFVQAICDHFRLKTRDEWVEIFQQNDVVYEKLQHIADVSKDQQAWDNNFLTSVRYDSGSEIVMPSNPVQFADFKPAYRTTGIIGRDTDEILGELGLSADELAKLREQQAIR